MNLQSHIYRWKYSKEDSPTSSQFRVFIPLSGDMTPERIIAERVVVAFMRHWFVDEQAGFIQGGLAPLTRRRRIRGNAGDPYVI